MDDTCALDPFQSGFKSGFWTKIALVAPIDVLHIQMGNGNPSLLLLLFFLPDVDTMEHFILLKLIEEKVALGCVTMV